MQVGVVYPQTELGGDPAAVGRIGLAVEELGYDYLMAYDHVVGASLDREPKSRGPYSEADPFHDPFVMFAYLAGLTKRIDFVTGVLSLPQRQTVLVAQQSADLDLLSGERQRLGIGVGWNYVEYDALGQSFDTRGLRADEQIELMRRLWTEPLVTFHGRFDSIDRGNINPRPKRSIPIWIGGFSEPAFRRGGRLGDGFIFAAHLHDACEGWARVRHHLTEAGRSAEGYGKELMSVRARSVDASVEMLEQWEAVGGTHFAVVTMNMGLDSATAHIDFLVEVSDRIGLGTKSAAI